MPAPPTVVKTLAKSKTGKVEVEFTSNVDRCNYTLRQLIQKANQEVGKYIAKQANLTARTDLPVYKKGLRVGTKIKSAAFQYWARKQENDLLVGIKHATWYGTKQELGEDNMPKHGILYNTVHDNIDKIREIQAAYLSAIEDDIKAQKLAAEAEAAPEVENE